MVVNIQRYASIDDGMGGTTKGYVDHLTVDGYLDQLNADEILANDRLGQVSSHVFITFEIADITRTDRVIIDNEIYHIKDVDNPMNMDKQLEITLEYTGEPYEI